MRFIATIIVLAGSAAASAAAEKPAAPTFEKDIRPIFKTHCFHCHGESKETKGGLDLRLRRFLAKGGESGPAIVPGKPEKSYLLERLVNGEMPPGKDLKKKIDARQIALIKRWIATGAKTARPEPDTVPGGFLITYEERNHWAFRPIKRPDVPRPKPVDRVVTPIDAFLLVPLQKNGATFAAEADKRTLVRRAYFDLIGLPPTPEQVDQFLKDDSPKAWEKLIDKLLASPHYGERWGRHWLDVAGYADSDGADNDRVREYAYRYRDYVIRAFNADKPFDQFIREQLAGDELAGPVKGKPTPEQAEQLIATGFLQMAPDATGGGGNRLAAHNQLMADTIKIVSTSLLGLSVGCARCHDHRFDPISQDDYYRFRAIFEPALSAPNWMGRKRLIPYSTDEDKQRAEAAAHRQEMATVMQVFEQRLARLPANSRAAAREAFETPEEKRTKEQQELLADAQLNITPKTLPKIDRMAANILKRTIAQAKRQGEFLQAVREAGGRPARTMLFHRGNPEEPKYELQPGELTVLLGNSKFTIPVNDSSTPGSGRRLAYAKHLTDGKHPLVARVIVNRVWMHHFGRGLCDTPADFGMEGSRPSHPELLDWLASEFMQTGWSLKKLHKLIMTSAAYRQGAQRSQKLQEIDSENRLLGGFPIRRLEAEIVRDAILAVSGELNPKRFGTAVPVMKDPAGEIVIGRASLNAGVPLAVVPMFGEELRRSVYVQTRRTMPLTFMKMFDSPKMEPNCEARTSTTVAPQSLVLMNSPFVLKQSMSFAERVRKEAGTDIEKQIHHAWQLAFARPPTREEIDDAKGFLKERADYFRKHPPTPVKRATVPGSRGRFMGLEAVDLLVTKAVKSDPQTLALSVFCQMLMSSNEFLYVP